MKRIQQIAKENFLIWNQSLSSGDPKNVAALYSRDCTFLPTLSEDFKIGRAAAQQYFSRFLKMHPNGTISNDRVEQLGDGSYLHCGFYDFELDGKKGREVAHARFTFIWKLNDNHEWRIFHHHSSMHPHE
ncbi:SgcJ/EcaC family oxidoreductase [Candidatus Uhrbacteria bacterium]|nr:SgcJ/EcaC family oxidoreductase [Candidatus Uhrbacteria bacterium]